MLTRNTIQKSIIYETVINMHNHPTAEEIYISINKKYPHISKGTVYRNLNILADNGKINRIEIPNGSDRYDVRKDIHHHLKCITCNNVYDVEIDQKKDIMMNITNKNDFQIDSYQIIFTGKCNNCINKIKED